MVSCNFFASVRKTSYIRKVMAFWDVSKVMTILQRSTQMNLLLSFSAQIPWLCTLSSALLGSQPVLGVFYGPFVCLFEGEKI